MGKILDTGNIFYAYYTGEWMVDRVTLHRTGVPTVEPDAFVSESLHMHTCWPRSYFQCFVVTREQQDWRWVSPSYAIGQKVYWNKLIVFMTCNPSVTISRSCCILFPFSRITGSIALFVLTNDDDTVVVVVAVVMLLLLYLSCPTIVVIFNNTN